MVLGAGAVVATAGAALPAVAAVAGTAGTVAGAGAAAGAVAGAATGAVVGGTIGAATVAGGTAVATATAAGSAAVAGTAITTAGVIAGPIGWLVLGSSLDEKTESGITYDCWKPVLHDTSSELSQGKLLREVMEDPRIKQVIVEEQQSQLPLISLVNIWDEKFDIQYMLLPSNNQLATHAIQIQ